jgi:NIMA (never in mitosis gene a)-related kinase 1/4/5
VLYELCTLKRAFDGQSLPALVVRILRGKYPPIATRYSTPLRCLVDSMLKQNPKVRSTAPVCQQQQLGRVRRELTCTVHCW